MTISDEIPPDELTPSRAEELLAQSSDQRELGTNPETGLEVSVKNGRYGPYVTEAAVDDRKPRTASLFKSMSPETVTLEEVLPLFRLPRVVGLDPAGEEVIVSNGRYGPFAKRGSDTRSLQSEEELLTITLDEALALLAQPKQRGRGASAAPLRELGGSDPVSNKPLVIKNGRFGPYVTDGETNASLRADDQVESLTLERAYELMAARRERGPSKPRRKRS